MREQDNWDKRTDNMLCRTCVYFVKKGGPLSTLGRCRRRAPTLNGFVPVDLFVKLQLLASARILVWLRVERGA